MASPAELAQQCCVAVGRGLHKECSKPSKQVAHRWQRRPAGSSMTGVLLLAKRSAHDAAAAAAADCAAASFLAQLATPCSLTGPTDSSSSGSKSSSGASIRLLPRSSAVPLPLAAAPGAWPSVKSSLPTGSSLRPKPPHTRPCRSGSDETAMNQQAEDEECTVDNAALSQAELWTAFCRQYTATALQAYHAGTLHMPDHNTLVNKLLCQTHRLCLGWR
jgi:hypothetical protein